MTMRSDIAGRVRNTPSFKSKPLLPLFEAVINSFQSISESENVDGGEILISLDRERLLIEDAGEPILTGVTIRDNGLGFTPVNFESFNTADSMLKAEVGGKGVGRFTWLVAFENVEIKSVFFDGDYFTRSFTFSRNGDPVSDQELMPAESGATFTTISLRNLRNPYDRLWPQDAEVIGRKIIEHCLLYFFDHHCPKVVLTDGLNTINLNELAQIYKSEFTVLHQFEVGDYIFDLTSVRLYDAPERDHKIYFAAHQREVKSFNLEKFIPNLSGKVNDDGNGSFTYVCYVQGKYLDANVSTDRSGFDIPETFEEQEDGRLFRDIPIEAIREEALLKIKLDLGSFLEAIDSRKELRIEELVTTETPEYRILLPHLRDFIDRIPPSASKAKLDEFLNDELHKKRKAVKASVTHFLHEDVKEDDDYLDRAEEIMQRLTEIDKSALAAHVTHRRLIIDLLERRDRKSVV